MKKQHLISKLIAIKPAGLRLPWIRAECVRALKLKTDVQDLLVGLENIGCAHNNVSWSHHLIGGHSSRLPRVLKSLKRIIVHNRLMHISSTHLTDIVGRKAVTIETSSGGDLGNLAEP